MEINAAEFRLKCFKLLDHVERTHGEVIITKRGKPVAKLVPIKNQNEKEPLLGALRGMRKTTGDLTEPGTNPENWEND